jgi:kynurenine formamidase
MNRLLDALRGARIYDLAQPYYPGMPHHPTHPPFLFGLIKQHGEFVGPDGHSSSAEAMTLGGHVGTHMDAFCHYSMRGKLFGGREAAAQSPGGGHEAHSVDTIAPVLRRGVLLDIARLNGGALPEGLEVTPEHLEEAARRVGTAVSSGDVVLLRTGWAAYWNDAARFVNGVRGPGPSIDGARWLSARGIFAAGSDTLSFEKMPAPSMPVHVHFLVESGIHIMECLNLEDLAGAGASEFVFVAAPLKIKGATASPIRPLAIA